MKDYLNEINDKFPIRRKKDEKAKFADYVKSELGDDRVKTETLEKDNNNIIIGNPESARVVITAHYDTPAASVVPNMMFPANRAGIIVNLLFPVLFALFSFTLAYTVCYLLDWDGKIAALIYLVVYLGGFYCMTRLFSNKHNKNDNTSGVATVMTLAKRIDDERVAFILFDNEELGLVGSKAYSKAHSDVMKDKLLINLDCVGNGDQVILMAKERATKTAEYQHLHKAFCVEDDNFTIHHIPFRKASSNSDHKSFLSSVGITAASRGHIAKFVTGRIHTSRDTVADSKNIFFLSDRLSEFLENIEG